jgi:hypothetical protein
MRSVIYEADRNFVNKTTNLSCGKDRVGRLDKLVRRQAGYPEIDPLTFVAKTPLHHKRFRGPAMQSRSRAEGGSCPEVGTKSEQEWAVAPMNC